MAKRVKKLRGLFRNDMDAAEQQLHGWFAISSVLGVEGMKHVLDTGTVSTLRDALRLNSKAQVRSGRGVRIGTGHEGVGSGGGGARVSWL